MINDLQINGTRLWDSIMEIAKIDALPNGGCGRLTLSDGDKRARDLFRRWCEDAGCTVVVDRLGNMFGRREGRNPDLPPIAIGSHLDTQPHGGKFDGVYGVLAGLEVIRTLNDLGLETDAPIEVVNWTNEEGARFSPAMLCSGVYAGLFSLEFALNQKDADGALLKDELDRIDYAGPIPCGEHKLGAFLEAHIEQGPILEANDEVIGVVTGGQGQRWYDITVTGQDAHSGSTPMPGRRDALVSAASLIAKVQEIALAHGPHGVGTVGEVSVLPNSRNTIPGEVRFTIDFRHPDDHILSAMDAAFRSAAEFETNVQIDIDMVWHNPPVQFDATCVSIVEQAAASVGLPYRQMVSGAGHDACQVARKIPTAMVFVPCRDGLSHNEAEWAEPEHLTAGCNVLLRAALELSAQTALEN
ncbi:Zn-dependent hydrolase [Cochlodiniinecator piscidefendens]|uniref:Zn-dependent hydrolase n=1 Tax=Cochlodiniinecator piscidefendens TaxID=2715756 RepID=UPI00140D0EE9|nr:Zn-dependent hydrolase [Cochlodiniinecator piscidefendens]